ncbi:MAG: SpoIIE family protein phosphatase, partial [Candidatus Omnitrophota bacterium]
LERLAEKILNAATLIIISYRDTDVDEEHPLIRFISKLKEQGASFLQIPVKSFSLNETAQITCQILLEKQERILPLANELQGRAKGNPFFTLELLHSLVDSEVVFLKEDHYAYDLDKLKTTNLPTTIVDAVLKRMKDLSQEHLEIISYASIMGKEIEFRLLTELTGKSAEKIVTSLEEGIKNQLLFRDLTGQENIFFMHDRIREAFYQRVPKEERVPLHRHIAEVIEEQSKDNIESVLYDLAHHFSEGEVEDKALKYAIPAADKAKSTYANTLAINLYNTAKQILEKQSKTRTPEYAGVMESLGEVQRLSGKFDESIQTLKECESLIPQEDKLHKAQVFAKMGDTLFEKGDIDNSGPVLVQALSILGVKVPRQKIFIFMLVPVEFTIQIFHILFPNIFVRKTYQHDLKNAIIAHLLYRLGYVYYFSDAIKMYYVCARGLNLAETRLGPCRELIQLYAISVPGHSTTILPWTWRAVHDAKKALKMAQKIQDKIMEGVAYSYLCLISYLVNKPLEGVEYGNKGIKILKGLGEYWIMSMAYAFRDDHNNFIIGRFQDSKEGLKEFLAVTREVKSLQNLGWAMFIQARISYLLGDIDLAIESAKESIHWLQVSQDKMNEEFATAILGYAYLKKGEYDKAIEQIEKAMVLFWRYATGGWAVDIFHKGAEIYFGKILNTPNLSRKDRKSYLGHALWFCMMAGLWSFLFPAFRGWNYQIKGTYLWLNGRKRAAIRAWEKGLDWLRTNKTNPGGDKYRIGSIFLEEAKFLLMDDPKDKKAYSNLIEARDLFTEMGCKLDLGTANKLLEFISPEGISVDSRQVLTQKRHLDSLLSVTQAIGSIFILDELLQKILEYGLKVTGAERGFLLLYDQAKNLSLKVSSNLEKDLQGLSFSYENYKLSLELINEVQNSKAAVIAGQDTASTSKISNELKTFSVKQAIAVPLQTRDKPIGILYMDNRLAGGTFGKDELELMKGFAVQASVSIENAFLVSSLVEQERLKQELELGRQIQESLLPKESPVIQGLKLSGLMLPAKEIGGDYYDFVTPEDPNNPSVSIVIGDVSGKGVAAGLLMAMAKTAIHTLSQEETSPKQILLRTNQILVKHIGAQKFMTMLYFRYDTQTKTLTYSSAGHEHILIYRNNGKVESIISGGFMLGMVPDISAFLEDKQISLNPGDKIILYTDGVTEARNPQEDLFGLEKLIELIQKYGSKPAEQLLNSIKEEVYSYIGTREQYDDITLVVMEAT